jgi:hypothetical protein
MSHSVSPRLHGVLSGALGARSDERHAGLGTSLAVARCASVMGKFCASAVPQAAEHAQQARPRPGGRWRGDVGFGLMVRVSRGADGAQCHNAASDVGVELPGPSDRGGGKMLHLVSQILPLNP